MALAGLGMDPRVADLLAKQGIEDLYPPQKEAWKAVSAGQNVLVSIPTASGKSLVAYLGILHRWLRTGRKSIYIVPLRALASEKYDDLQAFRGLGLSVGIATGDLDDADPKLGRNDVIVCTSEKADALLRHRTSWITEVGCLVADELHLIQDPSRGPTLEVTLARFRDLVPDCQMIGLSATVHNAADVARWLGATLIQSDWRPTKLHMGTYLGDELLFDGAKPRDLPAGGDAVTSLVEDTLKSGGQCLVFVGTRRNAEAQAQRLAGPIRDLLSTDEKVRLAAVGNDLGDGGEGSPTGKKLKMLVEAGVAFHTAGLDSHQRKTLERAFRDRTLKVLCATPTLAAGVNTPARRVIIRDLKRFEAGEGSRPLPVLEVKQMMGRAGRPRYDPFGEAVLIVKTEDEREAVVESYLRGEPEPLESKLAAQGALRTHALASVAGDYCGTVPSLLGFFGKTFWASETSEWRIRDAVDETLDFLTDNDFLARDGERLRATAFGRRTSDLYIDPLSALRLRQALESGGPAADVPSPFAMLQAVAGCPDVFALYLRKEDDWVQQRFWEHHEELLCAEDGKDLEAAMAYAKTAFLLLDWMDEYHLESLETKYLIGPGDLRSRVDSAAWLLHAMKELARTFQPTWQTPLTELGMRLEDGVKAELLPLLRLRGVGRIRARTLWKAGFHAPRDIAKAPETRIAALPGFGPALAKSIRAQVGGESKEASLQEEAPASPGGMAPAETSDNATSGQMRLGRFGRP